MSSLKGLTISDVLKRLTERGVSSSIIGVIENVEHNFSVGAFRTSKKIGEAGSSEQWSSASISKVWDTLMSFIRAGDLTTIPRKGAQTCKSLLYMLSFQSSPLEDRIGKLLSYVFVKCRGDNRVAVVHTDADLAKLEKWVDLLKTVYAPYAVDLPHERKDLVIARHSVERPCVDCYEIIP